MRLDHRRVSVAVALACFGAAGCMKYVLSPEDVAAARASAVLDLIDYRRSDASAPDPFARSAFCAANSILERGDAGPVDAGALIVCHPPPKPKPITADPQLLCRDGHSCLNGHCFCEWDEDAGK